MKNRNKLISLLLAAALTFSAAPAADVFPGAAAPAAESVEAAEKKVEITNAAYGTLTIGAGETFQLKTNRQGVKWKTSNAKVVTVSKTGKLKGVKAGTATVTAKAGKTKAKIQITVGTKVAGVNVVKPAMALIVGAQSTIRAEVSPQQASNKALAYHSANAKIASVSKDGVVSAKKVGQTRITVEATDGSGKSETVIVTVRAAESGIRLQDDFYQADPAGACAEGKPGHVERF